MKLAGWQEDMSNHVPFKKTSFNYNPSTQKSTSGQYKQGTASTFVKMTSVSDAVGSGSWAQVPLQDQRTI